MAITKRGQSPRSSPKPDSPAKRARVAAAATSRKCNLVEAAIQSVDEAHLSTSMREMLSRLVECSLGVHKDQRHPFQAAAVTQIQEVLNGVKARLDVMLSEALAKVDGADGDRKAREEAASSAKAAVPGLEEAVAATKEKAAQAVADFKAADEASKAAKAAQKDGDAEVDKLIQKKNDVEAVINGAITDAKQRALSHSEASLTMKLCKSLDVDKSLQHVLPEVIEKHPDKRGSFDAVTLTNVEEVLKKHVEELGKKIAEGMPAKAERGAAVEAASKAFDDAKRSRDSSSDAAADAKTALGNGRDAVRQADKAVDNFLPDLKKNADALDKAKDAVIKFAEGAYAGFTELRDKETPSTEPAEVAVAPTDVAA